MSFQFLGAPLDGLVQILPTSHTDHRGTFFEVFRASAFEGAGLPSVFVQENHSVSRRGVLRGIHYQKGAAAQGKLVRVTSGEIWDVAVDLRQDSTTFGRWFGTALSAENRKALYVPAGFGHATLSLSDQTEVVYLCTQEYDPASESGIRWNDPDLAVTWPDAGPLSLSTKDEALPSLRSFTP